MTFARKSFTVLSLSLRLFFISIVLTSLVDFASISSRLRSDDDDIASASHSLSRSLIILLILTDRIDVILKFRARSIISKTRHLSYQFRFNLLRVENCSLKLYSFRLCEFRQTRRRFFFVSTRIEIITQRLITSLSESSFMLNALYDVICFDFNRTLHRNLNDMKFSITSVFIKIIIIVSLISVCMIKFSLFELAQIRVLSVSLFLLDFEKTFNFLMSFLFFSSKIWIF